MARSKAISARGLNRATLARQLLLRREAVDVVEAVSRVVALQAQTAPSPYLALWNRIAGFDAADLDSAYREHAIVKATLVRITLHAVTAEDYPQFQHAVVSLLRAARLNDRRFKDTGLSTADADAMVADLLAFTTEPRTNAEVEAWVEERIGRPAPRAWWALRTYVPVVHAPTGGPWTHGARPAYVAARSTPPTGDSVASMQHLVRRYLAGFGPATAQDIAQFTFLRKPGVSAALDALAGDLVQQEGPTGQKLYDVPGAPPADEDAAAPPRLMAMWDNLLLAYADRSRVVRPEHRTTVFRRNGDVLPTVLVDGYVAGVWRPVDDGIEVTSFHALPSDAWDGLAAEARALIEFLSDREPAVYRRYSHWWDAIDGREVRVLPG